MEFNYETAKRLAQALKYHSFTPLQEEAFLNPDIFLLENNFFILGETSSGKTLIPLLRYYLHLKKSQEEGLPIPKMLFIVPYRALAAQKLKEFQAFFKSEALEIVQSTGEFRQDDYRIQQGDVDVAVIIAEKTYRFASRDETFLSRYDLMVIDEIGLIDDVARGGRIDFLLLWAKGQKDRTGRPGITALGTPSFDWGKYMKSFDFHLVNGSTHRPVDLEEHAIFYSAKGISSINGANGKHADIPQLHRLRLIQKSDIAKYAALGGYKTQCDTHPSGACSVDLKCRYDHAQCCPISARSCPNQVKVVERVTSGVVSTYILTELCKWHLAQGHQILIFQNDRELVRQLCLTLSRTLSDVLPEPAQNAKEQIIQACKLDAEDLVGIMEPEHYQAFSRGIAFHSAAMPNELRSYVENNILESTHLKIVCCTETLAFGVNSTVDVVIIASMIKPENGTQRFLTLNEYSNYVGRAGRLRKNPDERKSIGYVYPLINIKTSQQVTKWEALHKRETSVQTLYSHFFDSYSSGSNSLPLYLLNMFPLSGNVSLDSLKAMIQLLPCPNSYDYQQINKELQTAIHFLLGEKLIVQSTPEKIPLRRNEHTVEKAEKKYELSMLGRQLSGYIISSSDYQIIRKALDISIHGVTLNKAEFLYLLLQTKQLEDDLRGAFRNAEEKLDQQQILEYFSNNDLGLPKEYLLSMQEVTYEKQLRIYYVFGALLGWCEGMSAGELYRKFGVLYPLLQKAAEQIGYLLEISKEIIPSVLEERSVEYRQKGWPFDFETHYQNAEQQVNNLFISIYYGINIHIYDLLITFLKQQSGPDAQRLAEALSLDQIEPQLARDIRRIVVRYRFFERPAPVFDSNDKEAKNNYRDQFSRYCDDISKLNPPYVEKFFKHSFPATFQDSDHTIKIN